MVYGSAPLESPNPRRSIAMHRHSPTSAPSCGSHIVRLSGNACRKTTGRPEPTSSYAISVSPTSAITERSLRFRPLRQHLAPVLRHGHGLPLLVDGDEHDRCFGDELVTADLSHILLDDVARPLHGE